MAYPPPLIIPPLSTPHKQTLIILHGRGSSAQKFAPPLLSTEFTPPSLEQQPSPSPSSSSQSVTLRTAFPHAKFVFPTAQRTRATLYNRAKTNQWFDNWDLEPPATDREELQAPGLKQTVTYLHGLLEKEIAEVPGGARNVILWGLSQGCAASLMALLLWKGEQLGGVVGMCGWLPYAGRLEGEMRERPAEETGTLDDDDDDLFERSDSKDIAQEPDPTKRAINWLREELELRLDLGEGNTHEEVGLVFNKIPVFLGHGVEDEKVSVVLGRAAFSCLRGLGVDGVEWKEYEGLGHWYSSEMLSDIVS